MGASGKLQVTLGTMMVNIPVLLLLDPTGDMWKLDTDWIGAAYETPPMPDTLTC